MNRQNKHIVYWLFTGCVLIYLMVLLGGMTRLTHSGLSMVEWSPTGSLPPLNDADWQLQFEKYKTSPEFKLVNSSFTLDDFKGIFWLEFIHRFLGRIIGIVFFVPFMFFLFYKKFPNGFLKKMIVVLCVGSLQGLLGWYMVQSGLVKNPNVSHYRLAAHLITAFTAFGFTFWYALDLLYPEAEKSKEKGFVILAKLLLPLVIIQIVYGGFVAGLKAGYLYPTFPKMGDDWIPDAVLTISPISKMFSSSPEGVLFIHRGLAYLVFILVAFIYFKSKQLQTTSLQKKISLGLLIITLGQFLLGVITVLYSVPISIALLHQTGAFILFSASLFLLHRVRR